MRKALYTQERRGIGGGGSEVGVRVLTRGSEVGVRVLPRYLPPTSGRPAVIERILRHLASKDLLGLWPEPRVASLNRRKANSGRVPAGHGPVLLVPAQPDGGQIRNKGVSMLTWLRTGRIWRNLCFWRYHRGQTPSWRGSGYC